MCHDMVSFVYIRRRGSEGQSSVNLAAKRLESDPAGSANITLVMCHNADPAAEIVLPIATLQVCGTLGREKLCGLYFGWHVKPFHACLYHFHEHCPLLRPLAANAAGLNIGGMLMPIHACT